MNYLVLKFAVTAGIVVIVSELSKRSVFWAGLLASLPLTSYLAFLWLYAETRDAARIAALSKDILRLILPSLILFAACRLSSPGGSGTSRRPWLFQRS